MNLPRSNQTETTESQMPNAEMEPFSVTRAKAIHTNDQDLPNRDSGETRIAKDGFVLNQQDSGYVSLDGSPRNPNGQHDKFPAEIALCQRKLLLHRTTTKLKPYEKNFSPEYSKRFADLRELLGPSLSQHLTCSLKHSHHGPIAMNLRVLGTDEASAKPWIVILCAPRIAKMVRRFFSEAWVKSECDPGNARPEVPCLQVIVHAHAPILAAGFIIADAFGNLSPSDSSAETLCGSIIKVQSQLATIGGLVEIKYSHGQRDFYGLTVGHILTAISDSDAQSDITNVAVDEEVVADDEDAMADDEELYELDIGQDQLEYGDISLEDPHFEIEHANGSSWPHIGKLVKFRKQSILNDLGPDLDWALVSLPVDRLKPNMIKNRHGSGVYMWSDDEPEIHSIKSPELPAILVSGLRGSIYGTLTHSTSSLLIASGDQFANTYTMRLARRSGLKPGECGSWVIHPLTGRVFGHAVASDMLGDIYVIPLEAILDDIKRVYSAASVALPQAATIFDIVDTENSKKLRTVKGACIGNPFSAASSANQCVPADHDAFVERNIFLPSYMFGGSTIPTNIDAAELFGSQHANFRGASGKSETDSGYCSVDHSPGTANSLSRIERKFVPVEGEHKFVSVEGEVPTEFIDVDSEDE